MRAIEGNSNILAYRVLLGKLRRAKVIYERGSHNGREGAARALLSVIQFLDTLEEIQAESLTIPLGAISSGLADLERGASAPMFDPQKKTGRRSDSTFMAGIKGTGAATAELLVRHGQSLSDACTSVANTLNRTGIRPQRGNSPKLTGRTIRDWLERAREDIGRKELGTKAYRAQLEELAAQIASSSDPTARLLDLLKNTVRQFMPRPEKPPNPLS